LSTFPQARRRADLNGVFRIFERSVLVVPADASEPVEEGVGAVGVDVDLDPRIDESRPRRAWWDLQFQPPVGHAIVVLDLALLLNAQDLVEIDARNRREGRAGLGGGHGEAGVVDGQVDLADKGVGRLDRDDPREPELFGSRSWSVPNARSERPLAYGVERRPSLDGLCGE
jgi:hypothetical protein